jgi:hypothetical protein
MRRLLLGIAALTLPVAGAPAGAVVTAGTAGASAPVSCTDLSGNIAGTLTFKGCGGGLGKGTAIGSLVPAGAGTITWKGKNKGTTTVGNITFASPGQGGCRTGSAEQDVTGTVTANTSKAHVKGTTVSARVCVDGAGNQSLVKHTTLVL